MSYFYQIPKQPYSDAELRVFAEYFLRVKRYDEPSYSPSPAEVSHFETLMQDLPNWQQVLMVETRLPNLMASPEAIHDIYRVQSGENKEILGLFVRKSKHPDLHDNSVVWGGMYETRDKVNPKARPSLTFFHEQGHRVDHIILGSRIAGVASRAVNSSKALSSDAGWKQRVKAYVSNPSGNDARGDGIDGEPLYYGARRLLDHLTMKSDDCDSYPEAMHPSEATAEMMCHHHELALCYDGDERQVAQTLSRAYPTLWPQFDVLMLDEAKKVADGLYARREAVCDEAVGALFQRARNGNGCLDESSMRAQARLYAVRYGLSALEQEIQNMRSAPKHQIETDGASLEWLMRQPRITR